MKALVDTNVIVQKGLALLDLLKGKDPDPTFTDIVIAELICTIRQKAKDYFKKNKKEIANRYIYFGKLFLEELRLNKVILAAPTLEDLAEAYDLTFARDVDGVDAVLAVIAKRTNAKVLSNDKDFDRLKDYAERVEL